MTATAQTSGLPNPPAGADRLLAVARWLVLLLLLRWLTVRAQKLAAILQNGSPAWPGLRASTADLDRIHRGLHRLAALEADLLARRPTEQGLPIEARRAIAAEVIDICCDLGIFGPARATAAATTTPRRTASRPPRAVRSAAHARPPRRRGRPIPSRIASRPGLRAARPRQSTGPPARLAA